MRLALGVSYNGRGYSGWQSQSDVPTVQSRLELALSTFVGGQVSVVCAGRTDAGVHAVNQVVHLDVGVTRETTSWIRGTNTYLPADIALQWCVPVADEFHARFSALGRRYAYVLLESQVRPALEAGLVGWVFRSLDLHEMEKAAKTLVGMHDFSAFRSSQCQAKSPVKTMNAITIRRQGPYWRFDFDASAFLHHMVRNLLGCLVAIGNGSKPASWMSEVLDSKSRRMAAPTFSAAGLYFVGPYYEDAHAIPAQTAAMSWLPAQLQHP